MLPRSQMGAVWELELCTADAAVGGPRSEAERHDAHTAVTLSSHSLLVLRRAA